MLERFLRIERESLLLRLVAALGAAVALYTQQERLTTEQAVGFAAAYALYVGYAVALRHVLLPRIDRVAFAYGLILVDVSALLGIAVASQGIGASLAVLVPIFIAYYSTHLGYLGSFFTASAAVVGLVGYILLVAPAMAFDRSVLVAIPAFYLVATITGHLGQRAIREEAERRELEELLKLETGARNLLEAARDLHGTLNAHQLLEDVAKLAPEFTATSHCIIFLKDPDLGYVATASTMTPAELGANSLTELVEEPGLGWIASRAWRERAPVALRAADEPLWCHPVVASMARRIVAVPLMEGDDPFGVIYAFDDSDEPFPEQWLQMAARFGDLVNAAVTNARRYETAEEKVELLAAQLATAAKRLEGGGNGNGQDSVALDGLQLDGETSTAIINGRRIELSPTEFRLLRALARKAGSPVSEEELFRETWGDVYRGRTNVVEVYVHRLRRKLETDATSPSRIVTVRGAGYKIVGGPDAHDE